MPKANEVDELEDKSEDIDNEEDFDINLLEDDEDSEDDVELEDVSEDDKSDDEESDEDDEDEDKPKTKKPKAKGSKITESDLEDPEKRKEVLKQLEDAQSAIAQRAVWKERAVKAGWKKEEVSEKPKPQGKATASQEVEEARRLNELTNFRLDHSDIPRLMVREVERYARANNISMEKAMRSPLVSRFVNDKKLRERIAKASPTTKHRGTHSAPAKDWSSATIEEIEAHKNAVMSKKVSRS